MSRRKALGFSFSRGRKPAPRFSSHGGLPSDPRQRLAALGKCFGHLHTTKYKEVGIVDSQGSARVKRPLSASSFSPFLLLFPPEEPSHLFSEVFFCQKASPFYGLAQTLDDDLLFWFDFPASRWGPRLPRLQPAVQNRTTKSQIMARKEICDVVLPFLTNFSDKYIQIQIPEARGIPHVEVFTLRPLQLGQSNVLVCSVRNIFPPVARISWALHDQLVTEGVSSTQTYPIQGLDFQIFSYLEMTPQAGDVYSCTVDGPGNKFNSMAYWVPTDPIASKLLENALCGLAVAVGGLFMLLGTVLLALSLRVRSTD
ncbi:class II histocompatibility antigen, M alpha chain [Candoia aspera]|uniref:class II histocompatibility antigen, M alpha chain n=1 Tax=Candoia aspera TaxID=51853 RepID=UPI002FD7E333